MNNTTLFSVCYIIKHSPCIQRGTLVLVESHPLSLIVIWPEQPVTAATKGQLQKLARSFQLIHYTKLSVQLIAGHLQISSQNK